MTSRVSEALVLTKPHSLEPRTFPIPSIGEDDALLRVEACGVCGTDFEQYEGDMRPDEYRTPFPAIPGHEPVGVLVEVGSAAERRWGVTVGDRVVVLPVYGCGKCPECLAERPGQCHSRGGTYGLTDVDRPPSLWGGYAQYMYLHPMSTVYKISHEILASVASLVNPIASGFSWAVRTPKAGPGDHVVILGAGQRGLSSVVAARHAGVSSIVVTGLKRDTFKLELARRFGATHTVIVDEESDVPAKIRDLTEGGAHVVVDTTPLAERSLSDAIAVARQRGRIVLAGLKGRRPAPDVFQDDIVLRQLTIIGVSAAAASDFGVAVELLESERYPLAELHSRSFPLAEAEEAVLTAAGKGGREPVIHVAIEPNAPGV